MVFCFELQVGNTWRTTQDISLAISATWDSVMNNLEGTKGLARFGGPGGWNDADMLEVSHLNSHKTILQHLFYNVMSLSKVL